MTTVATPPRPSLLPRLQQPQQPPLPQDESFGACLLVKGDNDLLTEWIPYHYTVLPLRHVFIASDIDNPEDPEHVLRRWTLAHTSLQYHVVPLSRFFNGTKTGHHDHGLSRFNRKLRRQGKMEINTTDHPVFQQEVAHHVLMDKQRALITHCTRYMREKGVQWVTYHDTDEFLVVNTGWQQETARAVGDTTTASSRNRTTVMDVLLRDKESGGVHGHCQVLPRVTVGALENFTCQGAHDTNAFVRRHFVGSDPTFLSSSTTTLPRVFHTLRFQQHAHKDDFSQNRFAKAFVNIGSLTGTNLQEETPHNIHRPFPNICPRPVASVHSSPFYLLHYVGGWERFRAKRDARRGYDEWNTRAMIADSASCCDQQPYLWIHDFVKLVGLERAQYLLASNEDREAMAKVL
jgi:hypothetical protein